MASHLAQVALAGDVTPVVGHLSSGSAALRTRLALTQRQAWEAEERATHALGVAGSLGQVRWEKRISGSRGPLWNSMNWSLVGTGLHWAEAGSQF